MSKSILMLLNLLILVEEKWPEDKCLVSLFTPIWRFPLPADWEECDGTSHQSRRLSGARLEVDA